MLEEASGSSRSLTLKRPRCCIVFACGGCCVPVDADCDDCGDVVDEAIDGEPTAPTDSAWTDGTVESLPLRPPMAEDGPLTPLTCWSAYEVIASTSERSRTAAGATAAPPGEDAEGASPPLAPAA
jgi:hypothetical protein